MSDIDNAARNALIGIIQHRAPVSFLRCGIESIAAFTLKNAFVADYMHTSPFFGQYSRGQFKESRQFPPGVYMWFGAVATERHKRHGIYTTRYGKPPIKTLNGVDLFVFTWSAENLLLQLATARWINLGMAAAHGRPRLFQDASLDDTFIPFWPWPHKHIAWPSDKLVSHDDLDKVADRFRTIRFH